MRIVTIRELNSFGDAVRELKSTNSQLAQVASSLPKIMDANAPLPALAIGLHGAQAIIENRQIMFQRFEIAAYNFLGEKRRAGESPEEYFFRISEMSEEELWAAPGRNGLILNL